MEVTIGPFCFRRRADGSVRLRSLGRDGLTLESVILTRDEWKQLIADVALESAR